jgi:hypothetical protein
VRAVPAHPAIGPSLTPDILRGTSTREGGMSTADVMSRFQDAGHGDDHDYVLGSPHLSHPRLRTWITTSVVDAVRR